MKQPRSILITGASSGIGAALAGAYAGPGVFLALCGRNRQRLETVAESCRRAGCEVETGVLDVTDRTGLRSWIEQTDDRCPLDLVIANAGVSVDTTRSRDGEEQDRELMDVNVLGVLNTIHPIIPRMRARGRGQIALMSSLAALRGFPGLYGYCASKAAVKVYGEGLRGSLRVDGVEVSVICPGSVKTGMTDPRRGWTSLAMGADRAAKIIQRGLARGKPCVAFPWPKYFVLRILGLLSWSCIDRMLSRHMRRI